MQAMVQQGVVLAAGRGTRLRPLSDLGPKPLHPVCNKPIMQYQLEAMRDAGIGEIAIVIGPTSGSIQDYFGDGADLGLHLHYIEDPNPQGIAASLSLVENWVNGPFVVFLGDIFLALHDLTSALTPVAAGAGGAIVVRRDTPEAVRRNFAVVTDADGRIRRVIEMPVDPPTDLKGCGVFVFDGDIFDAIRSTPPSALRNERELTDAVQRLIDFGRPVYAADIVRWDVNVTYPEDLLACNLRLLREHQRENLIGAGAQVGQTVQLASSIIGDRAIVNSRVSLDECLVLPDTHVANVSGTVSRSIFGEGLVWTAPSRLGMQGGRL